MLNVKLLSIAIPNFTVDNALTLSLHIKAIQPRVMNDQKQFHFEDWFYNFRIHISDAYDWRRTRICDELFRKTCKIRYHRELGETCCNDSPMIFSSYENYIGLNYLV